MDEDTQRRLLKQVDAIEECVYEVEDRVEYLGLQLKQQLALLASMRATQLRLIAMLQLPAKNETT